MILKPLQRIEVIESKKKWKPGSVGYFICQDHTAGYNGWDMAIVFTRFGKKGKCRVETAVISTLMIEYDQLNKSDRRIMEIVKFADSIEPRIHPADIGRANPKYSNTVGGTIINPIQIAYKDLLEIETWDFMAYITTLSLYINKLSFDKVVHRVALPAPVRLSEFVGSGSSINNLRPHDMGCYIIRGLDCDTKKKNKIFEGIFLSDFDNINNRRECLEKLLISLSACKDLDSLYKEFVKSRYEAFQKVFNKTLKHYRRKKRALDDVVKKEAERINNANAYGIKPSTLTKMSTYDIAGSSVRAGVGTWTINVDTQEDDAPEDAENSVEEVSVEDIQEDSRGR